MILSTLLYLLKVKFYFAHKINAILNKLKKMMVMTYTNVFSCIFVYEFLLKLEEVVWIQNKPNNVAYMQIPEIFPGGPMVKFFFLGGGVS